VTNDYHRHNSQAEPSMFIRGVRKRTPTQRYGMHENKIVVGCEHRDAKYQDKIDPITIDFDDKHWVRKLLNWHAKTTFALADLRNKYADRDHKLARYRARRESHSVELRALVGWPTNIDCSGAKDDGSYAQIKLSTRLILDLNDHLSSRGTVEDAARRARELMVLLRENKFLA